MTILERLKSETLEAHKRLENRLDIFNQLRTLGAYKNLLTKLYQFYLPLEEILAQKKEWKDFTFDFSERERLNFLIKDLKRLGLTEHELQDLSLSNQNHIPQAGSFPEALGILYVLEGSTLGGQIISRHLNKSLGITPETGGSFYHGHGDKTGEMWLAFRELVTHYDQEHPQDAATIIHSAAKTFEKIEDWLTQ